ncbi:hypothetical protein D9M71_750900 [compost metagenome]
MVLAQQCGGHGEIAVGIEGFTGAGKALPLVTPIGLPETDIDPFGVVLGERQEQGLARRLAGGEAIRATGDI